MHDAHPTGVEMPLWLLTTLALMGADDRRKGGMERTEIFRVENQTREDELDVQY